MKKCNFGKSQNSLETIFFFSIDIIQSFAIVTSQLLHVSFKHRFYCFFDWHEESFTWQQSYRPVVTLPVLPRLLCCNNVLRVIVLDVSRHLLLFLFFLTSVDFSFSDVPTPNADNTRRLERFSSSWDSRRTSEYIFLFVDCLWCSVWEYS